MLRFSRYISSKPQGIGLLELMLSLSIMAALVLLSTMYFSTVSTNQRVTLATNMTHDIYAATKNYARTGQTISGIQTLIDAGYLSSYYAHGPWESIRPLSLSVSTADNTMTISFYNVPADACRKLISRLKQTINTSINESVSPASDKGCGLGKVNRTVSVVYVLY